MKIKDIYMGCFLKIDAKYRVFKKVREGIISK